MWAPAKNLAARGVVERVDVGGEAVEGALDVFPSGEDLRPREALADEDRHEIFVIVVAAAARGFGAECVDTERDFRESAAERVTALGRRCIRHGAYNFNRALRKNSSGALGLTTPIVYGPRYA
jgi:hypothetical protein